MAYLILKNDELEQGEPYEKYYEFDADDRDTVCLVEELLVLRSRSSDALRREIDDLLDDVSVRNKSLTVTKNMPKWLKQLIQAKNK